MPQKTAQALKSCQQASLMNLQASAARKMFSFSKMFKLCSSPVRLLQIHVLDLMSAFESDVFEFDEDNYGERKRIYRCREFRNRRVTRSKIPQGLYHSISYRSEIEQTHPRKNTNGTPKRTQEPPQEQQEKTPESPKPTPKHKKKHNRNNNKHKQPRILMITHISIQGGPVAATGH